MARRTTSLAIFLLLVSLAGAQDLRIGIIGADTSHVIEFSRRLNDPALSGHVAGTRIVAAFPGGSPDVASSRGRLAQFVAELRDKWKVEIVETIPALVKNVDGVLLMSVDGRTHLEQIRPVIAARKPVFIDKPMAASLKDVREIFRLCAESKTPCFSSSSLRFEEPIRESKTAAGDILGVEAFSPAPFEEHHPDLYWYAIHGVEILYSLMGTGCEWIERSYTEGQEVIVGHWKDGRIGTFRGIRAGNRGYGATVFGTKGIKFATPVQGAPPYKSLVEEIVRFMKTGVAPIKPEETTEMFVFMDAAQLSRARNGARVALSEVK